MQLYRRTYRMLVHARGGNLLVDGPAGVGGGALARTLLFLAGK